MLEKPNKIKISDNFSKYPGPRFRKLGNFSGEQFREDVLIPTLRKNKHVVINLDDTKGYGSSFLEESFGGAIREGVSITHDTLTLESVDDSLKDEIWQYIEDAKNPIKK